MRWPVHVLISVAAVLALAGGLSACGSDKQAASDYVTAVNQAVGRFEAAFSALQDDVGATSTPAQDQRTLGRLGAAVDRVLSDLRASRPPAEVASLHARLLAQVRGYRAAIDVSLPALASQATPRVSAARVRLAADLRRVTAQIQGTISAINRKLHP